MIGVLDHAGLLELYRTRLRELERRTEFLEGERRRLEWLLGVCLEIAVGESRVLPSALLGVLCELMPTNPARAAYIEAREQIVFERVLAVLRETA